MLQTLEILFKNYLNLLKTLGCWMTKKNFPIQLHNLKMHLPPFHFPFSPLPCRKLVLKKVIFVFQIWVGVDISSVAPWNTQKESSISTRTEYTLNEILLEWRLKKRDCYQKQTCCFHKPQLNGDIWGQAGSQWWKRWVGCETKPWINTDEMSHRY